ncbi:glycerophosphodiester phosphodiesterase family protein [Cohaesibacter celericrescens]|uniref:glycerophosphodiester phosphodiesterase family protein n=1 Tax=Cohaesibacter celericrescens TaxID=2067669 RepID=UPI003568D3F0
MTRIAAHRGGTLEYGDSTPAGFTATAKMELEEVEFDVHPTIDGAIIVHHDATLDRTTDRTGAIAEQTSQDVLAAVINYSQNAHPLRLEQLCEIFQTSPVQFRCEFKPDRNGLPYAQFVPRVVAMFEEKHMLGKTGFSSFLVDYLDEIALHSDRPRLWLVSPAILMQLGTKGVIETAKNRQIREIGVHIDTATPALMTMVLDAGIDFGCWAAHTSEQISKALTMGVKVFTSDRPSLAMTIRNQMQKD